MSELIYIIFAPVTIVVTQGRVRYNIIQFDALYVSYKIDARIWIENVRDPSATIKIKSLSPKVIIVFPLVLQRRLRIQI